MAQLGAPAADDRRAAMLRDGGALADGPAAAGEGVAPAARVADRRSDAEPAGARDRAEAGAAVPVWRDSAVAQTEGFASAARRLPRQPAVDETFAVHFTG